MNGLASFVTYTPAHQKSYQELPSRQTSGGVFCIRICKIMVYFLTKMALNTLLLVVGMKMYSNF